MLNSLEIILVQNKILKLIWYYILAIQNYFPIHFASSPFRTTKRPEPQSHLRE